jgi:hypothetical protein
MTLTSMLRPYSKLEKLMQQSGRWPVLSPDRPALIDEDARQQTDNAHPLAGRDALVHAANNATYVR